MIHGKFRGRVDRKGDDQGDGGRGQGVLRSAGAEWVGVNAEDASRTDDGVLIEFAPARREAGADRVRYCDTLGYDDPRTGSTSAAASWPRRGMPIELHCHNDLGMAVANSVPARSATSTPAWTRTSTPPSTAWASAPETPT